MIIKVLGSAAGGGFPQWNCNGPLSRAVWDGEHHVTPRTQSSLAVSADGDRWVLLNASPDIRQQIIATPALQPRRGGPPRNSPIRAIVLTSAEVDSLAGLLCLRERQPWTLYAPVSVLEIIASNTIFNVLDPAHVVRQPLPLDRCMTLAHGEQDLGLSVEAFAVPGKIALYLEGAAGGLHPAARSGETIGLKITDRAGCFFFYVPGCAALDGTLAGRLSGAPLVFFDGTLYSDDELVRQKLCDKTGNRMGHMGMSGAAGSLEAFTSLSVKRRIYIHINTSNPVLSRDSAEHKAVTAAGWEIAEDGMEIRL